MIFLVRDCCWKGYRNANPPYFGLLKKKSGTSTTRSATCKDTYRDTVSRILKIMFPTNVQLKDAVVWKKHLAVHIRNSTAGRSLYMQTSHLYTSLHCVKMMRLLETCIFNTSYISLVYLSMLYISILRINQWKIIVQELSFGGVHPETKVLLEMDVLGTKTQEKTVMRSLKNRIIIHG